MLAGGIIIDKSANVAPSTVAHHTNKDVLLTKQGGESTFADKFDTQSLSGPQKSQRKQQIQESHTYAWLQNNANADATKSICNNTQNVQNSIRKSMGTEEELLGLKRTNSNAKINLQQTVSP